MIDTVLAAAPAYLALTAAVTYVGIGLVGMVYRRRAHRAFARNWIAGEMSAQHRAAALALRGVPLALPLSGPCDSLPASLAETRK